MARNQVQFQKGLSEAAFDEVYGTEEQCHAALVAWRWPDGFECPDCRGRKHCVVRRGTRRLFQCNACRKQTSVRAGTIFASSKLPLRLWFKTIYQITQSKKGISSLELARRLGVTQTAAWMMKHKLGQVMLERNASKRLTGSPDGRRLYWRGSFRPARAWRRGQDAVRRSRRHDRRRQARSDHPAARPAFSKVAIRKLSSTAIVAGAEVVSDGLACFPPSPRPAAPIRPSRLAVVRKPQKRRLQMGQHRARQHQGRVGWNISRRAGKTRVALSRRIRIPLQPQDDLEAMIPRLAFVALRTPPMPYRLLKMADPTA